MSFQCNTCILIHDEVLRLKRCPASRCGVFQAGSQIKCVNLEPIGYTFPHHGLFTDLLFCVFDFYLHKCTLSINKS